MTIPKSEYVWDEYFIGVVGDIPAACLEWRERGDSYALYAIDVSAPDDVKIAYEKHQNIKFKGLARFYVPDMKEPYYTWEGRIVERASLEGRKLPLCN